MCGLVWKETRVGFFGLTVHQQNHRKGRCTAHGRITSSREEPGHMKNVPSWSSFQKSGEITIAIIGKTYMSFVKRGVHDQDGPYNCVRKQIR